MSAFMAYLICAEGIAPNVEIANACARLTGLFIVLAISVESIFYKANGSDFVQSKGRSSSGGGCNASTLIKQFSKLRSVLHHCQAINTAIVS